MSPSHSAFPLGYFYQRVKARVATYRHGWFKVLVWFLFGVMTIALFPGMVAVWFWRLSRRPQPQGGRRFRCCFWPPWPWSSNLVWLNVLVIDSLTGLGEAQDQLQKQTTAEAVITTVAPTSGSEPADAVASTTTRTGVTTETVESSPTTTSQLEIAAPTTTTRTTVPMTTSTTTSGLMNTTTFRETKETTSGTGGVLGQLAVVAESDGGVAYDRDLYGGWTRVRSGCNTRAVLEDEQRADGTWLSWYDRRVISNPSDLDIDHMAPLAEAHSSGGWQWSSSEKSRYADDLAHPAALTAVSASSNRSKGLLDPAEWRPSDRAAWRRYAADWVTVKAGWGLTPPIGPK